MISRASLLIFAAVMVAAVVAFSMMSVAVMAALDIRIKGKISGQERFYRFIRVSGHAAVKLDAGDEARHADGEHRGQAPLRVQAVEQQKQEHVAEGGRKRGGGAADGAPRQRGEPFEGAVHGAQQGVEREGQRHPQEGHGQKHERAEQQRIAQRHGHEVGGEPVDGHRVEHAGHDGQRAELRRHRENGHLVEEMHHAIAHEPPRPGRERREDQDGKDRKARQLETHVEERLRRTDEHEERRGRQIVDGEAVEIEKR